MSHLDSMTETQASVLSSMADVPRALRVATEAHAGQTDLAGEPYIWHCLRVMEAVDGPYSRIQRSVALLHDTLEDTSWVYGDLIDRGISEHVATKVVILTREDGISYWQYIERLCEAGKVPRMVKIADLRDNLDLSRLPDVTEDDVERARKYQDALVKLRRTVNS